MSVTTLSGPITQSGGFDVRPAFGDVRIRLLAVRLEFAQDITIAQALELADRLREAAEQARSFDRGAAT